jgi:hypothetical protein
MTTTYSDKPFMPGMVSEAYEPDQLIAGDFKLVTEGQRSRRSTDDKKPAQGGFQFDTTSPKMRRACPQFALTMKQGK